ncbi:MAG: hypothetical protein JWQ01_813 [Massilia sp.]|jgi:hypothetical protein|nr:hypothetical protein [Massilia sp.]
MSTPTSTRGWAPAQRALQMCLALSVALLLAPQSARAQVAVATPVLLQNLDFGTFAVLPSCNNCFIQISAAGARSYTPGIVILSSTNNGRPAQFRVTCNKGSCAYTPTISGVSTITAGGVTMTMGSPTFSKSPANTTSTLSVGARLTIPSAGAAVGTFTSTPFTLATSSP